MSVPFASLKHDRLGDARRNAAAALARHAVLLQRADDLGEIGPRRHLKRQPRQRIGRTGLERDGLEALPRREDRPPAVALEERETDDLGVVGDLPRQIGRGQCGVAQPSHRYHLARLPIANAVRAGVSRISEKFSAALP
jgi:hypothetical protein